MCSSLGIFLQCLLRSLIAHDYPLKGLLIPGTFLRSTSVFEWTIVTTKKML